MKVHLLFLILLFWVSLATPLQSQSLEPTPTPIAPVTVVVAPVAATPTTGEVPIWWIPVVVVALYAGIEVGKRYINTRIDSKTQNDTAKRTIASSAADTQTEIIRADSEGDLLGRRQISSLLDLFANNIKTSSETNAVMREANLITKTAFDAFVQANANAAQQRAEMAKQEALSLKQGEEILVAIQASGENVVQLITTLTNTLTRITDYQERMSQQQAHIDALEAQGVKDRAKIDGSPARIDDLEKQLIAAGIIPIAERSSFTQQGEKPYAPEQPPSATNDDATTTVTFPKDTELKLSSDTQVKMGTGERPKIHLS